MNKKYFNIKNILAFETRLRCDFINPIDDKTCELYRDAAICIKNGEISSCRPWSISESKDPYLDLSGLIAFPGFFDMHFHWVQDDVRLRPKKSLLHWLETYTWPYEKKFQNPKYSRTRARAFAKELLQVGTFAGACYASVHDHTVDDALEFFTGYFTVGHTLMTMNCPEYLKQTVEGSLKQVRSYSKKYGSRYCLTPRFAPTAHPQLMKDAMLASQPHGSFIQTHLSETKSEIEYALSLYRKFPGLEKVQSYTDIYKQCGILGPKTIMGHGIYLSEKELKLLSKTGTSIAHCPTSNAPVREKGLGSGLFDFRRVEKYNINWALGSDIGGGPYLSMIDVMRSFIKQNERAGIKEATATKAIFRATRAGAQIMRVGRHMGGIEKGMFANMVFLKSPRKKEGERVSDILYRLIMSGSRKSLQDRVQLSIYKGQVVYSQL